MTSSPLYTIIKSDDAKWEGVLECGWFWDTKAVRVFALLDVDGLGLDQFSVSKKTFLFCCSSRLQGFYLHCLWHNCKPFLLRIQNDTSFLIIVTQPSPP